MRHSALVSCFLTLLLASSAWANSEVEETPADSMARAKGVLNNIFADNAAFVKKHTRQCFEPMLKAQHPRATVVLCSDSRVQTYSLDNTPDSDLFVIRNIGNQIATAEGSVEYGVHHLNTPVLLVLGHTGCGAIKAALENQSELSQTIRKEVSQIKLSHKNAKTVDDELWLTSVNENIHAQVGFAKKKFAKEVKAGKLVVVGAVYDLHNMYKRGFGRIVLVDVNGETNAAALQKLAPLEGLDFTVP